MGFPVEPAELAVGFLVEPAELALGFPGEPAEQVLLFPVEPAELAVGFPVEPAEHTVGFPVEPAEHTVGFPVELVAAGEDLVSPVSWRLIGAEPQREAELLGELLGDQSGCGPPAGLRTTRWTRLWSPKDRGLRAWR